MREIRMLRSTRRGLETWHGRDGVTLADERARQQEHKLRPKLARESDPTVILPGGEFGLKDRVTVVANRDPHWRYLM